MTTNIIAFIAKSVLVLTEKLYLNEMVIYNSIPTLFLLKFDISSGISKK